MQRRTPLVPAWNLRMTWKWGHSSFPSKRGRTSRVAVAEACGAVSGETGTCEVFRYACPRLTLFAPSRSRALRKFPDGNFRRPLVGSGPPLHLQNLGSEMHRGGGRALPPRRAPFGRKESQPWAGVPPDAVCPRLPERPHGTPPPPRSTAPLPVSSHRAVSPRVEKIARLGVLVLAEPWEPCTLLFSQQRQMRTCCFASTRGQCGAGGRAFRGLTRSATEWSAARRKPIRAAALHFSAAISADVRPVGFRRAAAENFRPEIFEARATLRKQSGSTLGRRGRQPLSSVPVC